MLTVNQQEVNLGQVHFGKKYKFTYILTNSGASQINILAHVAGCKPCTELQLSKDTLEPGESADLLTIFTPGSLGITNKFINVAYREGGQLQPEITLKFKGVVVE